MKIRILYLVISCLLISVLMACNSNAEIQLHSENKTIEVDSQEYSELQSSPEDQVTGYILEEEGNGIIGAVVRLQTTELSVMSNEEGRFILEGIPENTDLRITAYSPGYYIKEADVRGGMAGIEITLIEHNLNDHPDYEWLSAGLAVEGNGDGSVCSDCHSGDGGTLPYDEWIQDAHASSGSNPRFLSMFNGTDIDGNQSPLTTYVIHRDYGRTPIRPTFDGTYFGPGFLLDFPNSSGNCSACHLPMAAIDAPYDTNPNDVLELAKVEGINCDFCHKVWGVRLNPDTGTPYSNMPGVISLELLRPPEDHQLFIGPFDDVAPGEDTYSPLQNQSEYCAACHFGDFWGIQIYNSFGEWLESPYADPESEHFQTCQDCHMPPLGNDHFAKIDQGGLVRDPDTIFSHKMLGASDIEFLQNTAELDCDVQIEGNNLVIDVSVENTRAGHHLPTDSPLRQIFMIVEVTNENGEELRLTEGTVLPDWAGDLADQPGRYYVKILEQLWTEISPTGAYWTQTRIVEDTRLAAFEIDESEFTFDISEGSEKFNITVRLIFRRAFYDLMIQKGWRVPDIEMDSINIEIPNE